MNPFDYERDTRRGYLDPEVAREYDENASGRGAGLRGILTRIVAHRERRAIATMLDEARGGRIVAALLDVPCGSGKLAFVLRGRAVRIVGADVSSAMLAKARGAFTAAGIDAELREADAAALPFATNEFDVVVCLRLLHRTPPPVRLAIVKELARVSSRRVILSLGIVDSLQRFRLALRRRILDDSPVPAPCTRREAGTLLEEAGLALVRERSILPGLSAERLYLAEKR